MAIRSNAFPFTLLVGLLVRAVAAARATSTGLVNVFCAATLTARRKSRIFERTAIFGIKDHGPHMSIASVAERNNRLDTKHNMNRHGIEMMI